MKVYLFGNEDLREDNLPYVVSSNMDGKIVGVEFIKVKPNQDLPFNKGEDVVILDTVLGIDSVEVIRGKDLSTINLSPRTSVHDFDLGFQLKYLQKLGKLGQVTIIGLPMDGKVDYLRLQSIFKKLVAQDMQGS